MSNLVLKLIACAAMLGDHIGHAMLSYHIGNAAFAEILRIIGRIAFPIFAFLIVQGFKKTHNVLLYILRLLAAGIISEIPFNLLTHAVWRYDSNKNVMFTLAISLVALVFVDMCIKGRNEVRFFCVFPILAACYLAREFGVDYGYLGVLLIVAIYFFDGADFKGKLCILPILLLFGVRQVLISVVKGEAVTSWQITQIYSALSFIPIMFYNGKRGGKNGSEAGRKIKQYLFYLFYPAHMLVIYLVFFNFSKIAALF